MTLQQEAYRRIDEMTDDSIRKLIDIIDKMMSITGVEGVNESTSVVSENAPMTKAEKKQSFMQSDGKIKICRSNQSAEREEHDLMILADTNIFIDFWNNPAEALKNVFIREERPVKGSKGKRTGAIQETVC